MNSITKVSDIQNTDVATYLRLPEVTADDLTYIDTLISVAISFILNYTGIADAPTLDNYADMVIVIFVLCQDMYDNRAYYVDNENLNKVVETILGMHQRNLL